MAYNLSGITVLVVDDNYPMLNLLKAMLIKFGVGKVVVATNGDAAFKKYCTNKPDVVISDWMMNPTDGLTLADNIRNNKSSPNPYVPFILMTGFSEEHRVVHARDTGITEFLLKPFSAADLYKRLVTIIEAPRQFVKSEDFFGPDRRRRDSKGYKGKGKRQRDQVTKKDMLKAKRQISSTIKKQGVESEEDIMLEDVVTEIGMVDRERDEQ